MAQRNSVNEHSPSIPWIIVSRLIGLAIYFIIVVILQQLHPGNPVIESISRFLSAPATIALVVIFSILFLVGEVFLALDFPVSLPGPFFNALGSVFLVSFLFHLLYLVDTISSITLFSVLGPLEPILYILVFFLVLIVQYVHLFSRRQDGPNGSSSSVSETQFEPPDREPSSETERKEVSWQDVETEFRSFLYDLFHSLRESLKKTK